MPERINLAEALWASVADEGHEPPITPAHAEELEFPNAIHFVSEPNAIIVIAVFHTKRDPRHNQPDPAHGINAGGPIQLLEPLPADVVEMRP